MWLDDEKRRQLLKPARKSAATGFSLIEMLIAIVVLGIGLALAMPSYRTWIHNTQIRTAAESILHGMQRARAEAVIRNTNTSFTLGGGALWTVNQVSDNSVIESRLTGEVSDTITFTVSPVPVAPATAPTTITFSNLGAVVANADASVTITQIDVDSTALPSASSRELSLTVGVGGVIRMCDPNPSVAVGDPRHC